MSVFVAVHLDDRGELARFPEVGQWFDYFIYEFSDDLAPRLNLSKHKALTIPSKEIAYAWKFAGVTRHHIKPRTFKNALRDQLDEYGAVYEPYKPEKDKYNFTDQDIKNSVLFMKIIIRETLYRGYDAIWNLERPQMSDLYLESGSTYTHEHVGVRVDEYEAKLGALVGRLAAFDQKIDEAQTIAECSQIMYEVAVDINPAAVA